MFNLSLFLSYILFSTHIINTDTININDSSCTSTINSIILKAKLKLGCQYKWGASGPDQFDCSGFIYYIFNQANINISRTTFYQCNEGERVLLPNIKKGNLVFFVSGEEPDIHITHVGLAITDYKNGNFKFIHASAGEGCVCINEFAEQNFKSTYGGARKLIICP